MLEELDRDLIVANAKPEWLEPARGQLRYELGLESDDVNILEKSLVFLALSPLLWT
jgi:hypothetical protein